MKPLTIVVVCLAVCLGGCSSTADDVLKGVHFFERSFVLNGAEYKCVMITAIGSKPHALRASVMVIPQVDLAPGDCVTGWAFSDKLLLGFETESKITTIEADPETVYFVRKRENGKFEDLVELRKTFAELGIGKGKHLLRDLIPFLETMIRENLPKEERSEPRP